MRIYYDPPYGRFVLVYFSDGQIVIETNNQVESMDVDVYDVFFATSGYHYVCEL